LDVLTSENLRETSKLFKPKDKSLQKTRLELFGKKGIKARVDQALIPAILAREILAQKKESDPNDQNDEGFAEHLNKATHKPLKIQLPK